MEETSEEIESLRALIRECPKSKMAFFGGAGVSTESGIPDFRSANGLYNEKERYPFPPEIMISRSFFDEHPEEFFDYYFDNMIALDAKPNVAHTKLAELEKDGILNGIITQNIDGLHQIAGSRNVVELHGSVHKNHCMDCKESYSVDDVLKLRAMSANGIPFCPKCAGIVKPDVVLYEEPLFDGVMEKAIELVRKADLLLIAGTSLVVYPAAGLLQFFQGDHLAIVNRDATPADSNADICIRANIGDVLDM